jgi:hypothetical protein
VNSLFGHASRGVDDVVEDVFRLRRFVSVTDRLTDAAIEATTKRLIGRFRFTLRLNEIVRGYNESEETTNRRTAGVSSRSIIAFAFVVPLTALGSSRYSLSALIRCTFFSIGMERKAFGRIPNMNRPKSPLELLAMRVNGTSRLIFKATAEDNASI